MIQYSYKSDEAVFRSILERKKQMRAEEIATIDCPHYLAFVNHVFSLSYYDKPDYDLLLKLL